jgi:hypothetical protein
MSNYSYKPIQTYFDAFKRRETITQDVRYPNNIAYAIMDPTNTPPNRTTLYTPNTLLNFDHLHNPYDRDVNPNFHTLPYCRGYWSQTEPNDHFGRPISTTYYAYNTQKKI